MTLLKGIILGIVQGLTEFLPVSSSGHLRLIGELMDVPSDLTFTVVVHLGTLLAVIIAFWPDVVRVIHGALGLLLCKFKVDGYGTRRMVVLLFIATLPLIIGAVLDKLVGEAMQSTLFVGIGLLITATALYFADKRDGFYTAKNMPYKSAAIIGLAQLFAIFPGISRSGSTISAGMFMDLRRPFAVRFAFLLSIPAVMGSFVFKLPDMIENGFSGGSAAPYIAGFFASLISGYMAIRLVRLLSKKGSLKYFAYYCAAVGTVTIISHLI